MEQEFKWRCPEETMFFDILSAPQLPPHGELHRIRMSARYYDTQDGTIRRLGGGLRLRQEDNDSICCLKLTAASSHEGALKTREEYECSAPDIRTGLRRLPEQTGAPADLCLRLADAPIIELGRTTFVRQVVLLQHDRFEAELSLDLGQIVRGEQSVPIHEIELELQSGDPAAFLAFGEQLQDTCSLVPEPWSKLARMLRL